MAAGCVQPSSRLYQRLDKLLLLSEGHTMYYGEPLRLCFFCACIAAEFAAKVATRGSQISKPLSDVIFVLVCLCSPALSAVQEPEDDARLWRVAGAANMAADWFRSLGFAMPYGVNVAGEMRHPTHLAGCFNFNAPPALASRFLAAQTIVEGLS